MSVLIFLIPITIGLGLLGLCCFLWSLKARQYEDLQGEASRILFDDADEKIKNSAEKISEKSQDKK